ncbi:FAD binding domain-containing protein [Phyllosticta capitalensis]
MRPSLWAQVAFSAFVVTGGRATEADPTFCCDALKAAGLQDITHYPNAAAYAARQEAYYNPLARLKPACIIQPNRAEEVSTIVKTLVQANKTQPCQFAIRAGGQTIREGAANIDGGVTIDLGFMNSTTYFAENKTAAVQPGARWGSVFRALDKADVASAGGRAASVGVGGLVLGGGNSFYSARKGLVCDNVQNFEVVLANGDIVHANSESNSDLFQVLKGGANNFGVVTRIDLKTFEREPIWGGVVAYPVETADLHTKALVNFGEKLADDPYASAIVILLFESHIGFPMVGNAYEYTKPIERPPPIFDEFLAIPGNFSSSMRITNMTDLTEELEKPKGFRWKFLTLTFQNDERILKKATELFHHIIETVGDRDELHLSPMFQPLPVSFTKHSVANGGNILGLDRFSENNILFLYVIGWMKKENDEFMHKISEQYIEDLDSYAKSIGKSNPYIYLPYADPTQDPLSSYGSANILKMRAAAAKYDPEGVFQTMVPGGFKLSKVTSFV